MNELKQYLADMVALPSITPNDAGCQQYISQKLETLGFQVTQLNKSPVANFFARIGQTEGPLLVFAGHTDVVEVGDLSKWKTDPFVLTEREGTLYGRGVADMKGSLAAMLYAVERFLGTHTPFCGSIGFLITSGEEGDHFHLGTPHVMEYLHQQGVFIDYCIVGEPSSEKFIADTIKIGRRGSLSARIVLHGVQGHVAYPHLAENPIHKISPALAELATTEWDKGNKHFPPTSMQVTRIQSGGNASNVIPGDLSLDLNFRFSTEQTALRLEEEVQACFSRHHLNPEITWRLNGEPFITERGKFLEVCLQASELVSGFKPNLSTSGGTSDGRFIAPYGTEVIELGLINSSIHQVNEWTTVNDISVLSDIYCNILKRLLVNG